MVKFTEREVEVIVEVLESAGFDAELNKHENEIVGTKGYSEFEVIKNTDTKFNIRWSYYTDNEKAKTRYIAYKGGYPDKYMKRDPDANIQALVSNIRVALADFKDQEDFAKKYVKNYDLIKMIDKAFEKGLDINDTWLSTLLNLGTSNDFEKKDASKIYPTADCLSDAKVYYANLKDNAGAKSMKAFDIVHQVLQNGWLKVKSDYDDDNIFKIVVPQSNRSFKVFTDESFTSRTNKMLTDTVKKYYDKENKVIEKYKEELLKLYTDFTKEFDNKKLEIVKAK